jgi:hypothetical protein
MAVRIANAVVTAVQLQCTRCHSRWAFQALIRAAVVVTVCETLCLKCELLSMNATKQTRISNKPDKPLTASPCQHLSACSQLQTR